MAIKLEAVLSPVTELVNSFRSDTWVVAPVVLGQLSDSWLMGELDEAVADNTSYEGISPYRSSLEVFCKQNADPVMASDRWYHITHAGIPNLPSKIFFYFQEGAGNLVTTVSAILGGIDGTGMSQVVLCLPEPLYRENLGQRDSIRNTIDLTAHALVRYQQIAGSATDISRIKLVIPRTVVVPGIDLVRDLNTRFGA